MPRMHGHHRVALGVSVLLAGFAAGQPFANARRAKHKLPSLSIKSPSRVKSGAHYSNLITGYSGRFNELSYYLSTRRCASATASQDKAETGRHFGLRSQHKFSVRQGYTAGDPGRRYFCVYLYDVARPSSSKQLHKVARYRVVAR
jgi:hypothetical protein